MPENKLKGVGILHIITRLDTGGSADVVLELARLLSFGGARVGIAAGKTADPPFDIPEFCSRNGIKYYSIPRLKREVSPLDDIMAFFGLRRIIKDFKPVIVHTHTSKGGILGRFAAGSRKIERVVHTPHGHIFYGYFSAPVTAVFIMLEKAAANLARRITVLTEKGKADHLQAGIGDEGMYRVIPSGVEIDKFMNAERRARNETGWENNVIVGWVGRLTAIKDCQTFIRAAAIISAQNPEARFIVAGEGEERKKVEDLAQSLGITEKVRFLGRRSDIPEIMVSLDIFVMSSLNEGFGRVLVEAMAAGKPVVATDVGGAKDVVEEGVTAFLVPPSDPGSMAEAVLNILKNPSLRETMGKAGMKRARMFDTKNMMNKFEEVYFELLSG